METNELAQYDLTPLSKAEENMVQTVSCVYVYSEAAMLLAGIDNTGPIRKSHL